MTKASLDKRPSSRIEPTGSPSGILTPAMTKTDTTTDPHAPLQVAVVTLGCARNEVDSEELAGRLEADGFRQFGIAGLPDSVMGPIFPSLSLRWQPQLR